MFRIYSKTATNKEVKVKQPHVACTSFDEKTIFVAIPEAIAQVEVEVQTIH